MTGLAIYGTVRATIDHLVDERIASESKALAPFGLPFDQGQLTKRIDALTRDRNTGDLGVMLTDRQGKWVAGNIRIPRWLPDGYSTLSAADGIAGLSDGRALVRPIGRGLRLTIAAETEPVDHYNAARMRIYLIGFGSIMAVVIGTTLIFVRSVRQRMVAMRVAVDAIIDGDMRRRVAVDGAGSAFDQQAMAFNRMLDRIGALMAQISNVSNDIAHELRTPLARLHQRIDLMTRLPEAEPLRSELEGALGEANRLLAMFTALLRIAEVEGGARRASFAPVALGSLCADTIAMLEPVAEDSGHRLVANRCDDLTVVGDRQLLSQMTLNLVENALRHTPPTSTITLGLKRQGDRAVLDIADDGPGIAVGERERALTRFGRGDAAGADGGHGLGLPLVDAIVRLHRGELRLEDAAPGLRILIALPLA